MKKLFLTIPVVAFGLAPLSGWAMSDKDPAMKNMAHEMVHEVDGFTNQEKEIIVEVFDEIARQALGVEDEKPHGKAGHGKGKSMPPGLAKRDELPPGLQQHIEKNGVLPPGLEGREIPDELKRRLPARKDGTEVRQVGDDIVLIEKATRRVLDILTGVAKD
ncbi:MAG: hypothetical protein H6868_09615 [Rhodospirillales bacterium]|nr:hypothetical protein [Rhodospirillales bacterium]